jgi:hypothetical protein
MGGQRRELPQETQIKPAISLVPSASNSPLFGAARVMDSSVYDLASALNSRRVGRMTPRSSMILHLAPILLPGGCVRALVKNSTA